MTLKEQRTEANLTVKRACELTGTPISTWHAWERGLHKPPPIVFEWLRLWKKYSWQEGSR